jgi:hypothetical protein
MRSLVLTTRSLQVVLNLDWMVSAELTDYGLDIHMANPVASLCVEAEPAVAKAFFARICNRVAPPPPALIGGN